MPISMRSDAAEPPHPDAYPAADATIAAWTGRPGRAAGGRRS